MKILINIIDGIKDFIKIFKSAFTPIQNYKDNNELSELDKRIKRFKLCELVK